MRFEPFVGVAPPRFMEPFSGLKRKHDDGRLVARDPETAVPRLYDSESIELRQNRPAYRGREQIIARVIRDLHENTGLGMRT